MGANCSTKRQTLESDDDAIENCQSLATLAEDPLLLEMGFGTEFCRLYDVIESIDHHTLKVVRHDEDATNSNTSSMGSDKTSKNNAEKKYILKRIVSDNPLSILRWYYKIDTLKHLNHCNVPRVIDFRNEEELYFVMQACEGDTLLERAPYYSERIARRILRQVLEVVNYLHSNNIVHGDIRAESFEFESSHRRDWHIFLTDFSSMAQHGSNTESSKRLQLQHDQEPCLYTTAPELILEERRPSKPGDMWSVGILLYQLLSGQLPFGGTPSDFISSMRNGPTLAFPPHSWKRIHPPAKDLIQKLLLLEPQYRLTAQQALKHGWVSPLFSIKRKR